MTIRTTRMVMQAPSSIADGRSGSSDGRACSCSVGSDHANHAYVDTAPFELGRHRGSDSLRRGDRGVRALDGTAGRLPAWKEVWHGVSFWGFVTLAVRARRRQPARPGACRRPRPPGRSRRRVLRLGTGDPLRIVGLDQILLAGAGALVGPLYGAAGAHLRDPASRHRPWVVGLVAAPCLLDGITSSGRQPTPTTRSPTISSR